MTPASHRFPVVPGLELFQTEDEVANWAGFVARVRYKSGWHFSVGSSYMSVGGADLRIRAELPNSRNDDALMSLPPSGRYDDLRPGVIVPRPSVIPIGLALPLGLFGSHADDRERMQHVRSSITVLEEHERDEWLRLDGQLFDDPHRRA